MIYFTHLNIEGFNMKYTKDIDVLASGTVYVTVSDIDGNTRGTNMFQFGIFNSDSNKALKKRLIKAHKWADERIKTLEEGV